MMSETRNLISNEKLAVIKENNYETKKRIFDFLFALFLLITMFPFLIGIYFTILIFTGKNPLYIGERGITFKHKTFRMIKFRTFKNDPVLSPLVKTKVLEKPEYCDLVFPFGKLLRKTGLDELPQLINIIRGEMSFVGPRPLDFNDLKAMEEDYLEFYTRRIKVTSKPGLTGYWQIFGNRKKGLSNLLELEEYYEKNKTFLFDLFIIFLSIPFVAFGKTSDAVV